MKADIVIKWTCMHKRRDRARRSCCKGRYHSGWPHDSLPEADKEYDAKGLLIMPGIIGLIATWGLTGTRTLHRRSRHDSTRIF